MIAAGEELCVNLWADALRDGNWRYVVDTLIVTALREDHAGYSYEAHEYSFLARIALIHENNTATSANGAN